MATKSKPQSKPDPVEEPVDAPEAPGPDAAEAEPAEEFEDAKGSDKPSVVRANAHSWWCPVCDRSHPIATTACDACGYVR